MKRRPPGQHRKQHAAEAVEIAVKRHRAGRRPAPGAIYSAVPTSPPSDVMRVLPNSRAMPKSASLTSLLAGQQQIRRLEIAMDHAVVVGMLERLGEHDAEMGRLAPVEPAAGLQLVLEIRPLDQLHHVIEMPLLLAKAIQANDVGVLELLEGLDLGLEPLAKPLFDGQPGAEDLDGRHLAGLDVLALIDGPHPAAADPLADAIGSQMIEFHPCNLTRRVAAFHMRRFISGRTIVRN